MLRKFTLLLLVFSSFQLLAQNKEFDKLEMLYNQGHYSMVYRRAERLLNFPEYDYSMMPSYYKAISTLHLAQNPNKYKREKYNIEKAAELLEKVKNSPEGQKIFEAHTYELQSLKKDLSAWSEEVRLDGDDKKLKTITNVITKIFGNIDDLKDVNNSKDVKGKEETAFKNISQKRQDLITYAKTLLGTPYVYGGTTTSGFDCSGFVGYVLNSQNVKLPRRSQDQFDASKKLKEKTVEPGDLVFFGTGGGISHVGMIYLVEKDKIYMIHASTNQGVVITEITSSAYWTKRLQGFGTFL